MALVKFPEAMSRRLNELAKSITGGSIRLVAKKTDNLYGDEVVLKTTTFREIRSFQSVFFRFKVDSENWRRKG
jgi:hypothetical protein